MISSDLIEKMKDYPLVHEYLVFESWQRDNRFVLLLMPRNWSYELIEAWFPNSIWNPSGKNVVTMSSSESYNGRTTYAETGGSYYAARLAVTEYLVKERRQACVLILREVHPGYIMPVGVWNVRESVRVAMRTGPKRFAALNEALDYITTRLVMPEEQWIKKSTVLKDTLHQKRLEDFTGA